MLKPCPHFKLGIPFRVVHLVAMTSAAVRLIEQGHAMYRDGNHKEALGFYTEALSMAVTKSQKIALHSNRAACFLKLHDFKLAAEECTAVLELDHKHTGALMLRAQTLVTLKEYQSALFDVNRLIDLNPSSEVYQNLQARLKAQLSLPPIIESEAEVEDDDIYKDESHVRNKIAFSDKEEKEHMAMGSELLVESGHDKKDVLKEMKGNKEYHAVSEPKGQSKWDYSKWDQLEIDSSDDEDDEDTRPQYQFRVKAVNIQQVK